MKTALCISGHLRTFDQCWPAMQTNVILNNNIEDIFVMTWLDSMGHFLHPASSTDHKQHPGFNTNSDVVTKESIEMILQLLKPKGMQFDNFFLQETRFKTMINDLAEWHHPSIHHRPVGTFGQVYGRCAAIKLKQFYENKHSFSYDAVIFTRWDTHHNTPINIQEFGTTCITTDGLYGPDVITDCCMVGPNHLMNRLGEQFESAYELSNNRTMSLGPHEWLKFHFDYKKIPWTNRSDLINITLIR